MHSLKILDLFITDTVSISCHCMSHYPGGAMTREDGGRTRDT